MSENTYSFGKPPEQAPIHNPRHLSIKNNRLQYPGVIIDIDDLFLSNLPSNLRLYGQFFQNNTNETEDRIIVFKYEEKWLFHRRTPYSDKQVIFPLDVLPWFYELAQAFFYEDAKKLRQLGHVKTVEECQFMLMEVGMENDASDEPGCMLYKVDSIESDKRLQNEDHQQRFSPALFLSYIGLFEQEGITVLEKALTNRPLSSLKNIDVPRAF